MSLTMYVFKEDIPRNIKLIEDNDACFYNDFNNGIAITESMKDVIQNIDRGQLIDNKSMWSYFGMPMSLLNLSTSTKTVINVLNHPNTCISMVECGSNAMPYVLRQKSGIILLDFAPACDNLFVDINAIVDKKCIHIMTTETLSDFIYSVMEGRYKWQSN